MTQHSWRDATAGTLVLLAALALSGCGGDKGAASPSSGAPGSGTTLAPVLDQDFPDPDVLFVDGTYYAYATQPGDGSANVQVAASTDLKGWDVQVQDPLPELPGPPTGHVGA